MIHEESLARKFVKKGFWLYLFTFILWPIGYITKMVISRDLSVSEVWVIYGVISFVSLLSTYNDLWCTESLNYFLPKYIVKKDYGKAKYLIFLTLKVQLLTSLLIFSIIFIFAPFLATSYFWEPNIVDILRISGIYFIWINLFHIASVFFMVSQDTKLQKAAELVRAWWTCVGVIILFMTDSWNVERYMWTWIFWLIIWLLFWIFWAYRKYYKVYFLWIDQEKDTSERKDFIKYSFATLLTGNIWVLFSQVDMQMIIYFLWSESTWYYSNYFSLMNIPFIFISPIVAFLFPVISELSSRSDIQKIKILIHRFTLYFSIIWIWSSVFLFQMGEHLAVVFFWEKFRESWIILAWSSLFLTFNLLVQVNFQALAWTWNVSERAKVLIKVLPINIVLNAIFIYLYGVKWSALAVWLSWIPLWYFSYQITKKYQSPIDKIQIIKNILLVILTYIILDLSSKILMHWWISNIKINESLIIPFAVFVNLLIFLPWNLWLVREFITTIKHNRK